MVMVIDVTDFLSEFVPTFPLADTVVTSALVAGCHGAGMRCVFITASHVVMWLAHGDLKEQD